MHRAGLRALKLWTARRTRVDSKWVSCLAAGFGPPLSICKYTRTTHPSYIPKYVVLSLSLLYYSHGNHVTGVFELAGSSGGCGHYNTHLYLEGCMLHSFASTASLRCTRIYTVFPHSHLEVQIPLTYTTPHLPFSDIARNICPARTFTICEHQCIFSLVVSRSLEV